MNILRNNTDENTTVLNQTPITEKNIEYKSNGTFKYQKLETLLKVENLSCSFGDNVVLKDVNVEIKNVVRPETKQGQIVGLCGNSGSGKTLLFEMLSGLRQPTTGTVLINNNGKLEPVSVGQVGVVQQKYPLFEHRTIYGNLNVAAKKIYSSEKERKERILHMLDRFKLSDKADYYPAQLSGGQRQRMAIAQQILCSENFLLLDEPFSGLDIKMVDKTCELLQEISHSNDLNTIIIVSHVIEPTARIADTLWIMGRDYDEKNNPIAGSKIKYEYDLIEMGLAWQNDIENKPEFIDLMKDIKKKFTTL